VPSGRTPAASNRGSDAKARLPAMLPRCRAKTTESIFPGADRGATGFSVAKPVFQDARGIEAFHSRYSAGVPCAAVQCAGRQT
jgi:hypothetical protein